MSIEKGSIGGRNMSFAKTPVSAGFRIQIPDRGFSPKVKMSLVAETKPALLQINKTEKPKFMTDFKQSKNQEIKINPKPLNASLPKYGVLFETKIEPKTNKNEKQTSNLNGFKPLVPQQDNLSDWKIDNFQNNKWQVIAKNTDLSKNQNPETQPFFQTKTTDFKPAPSLQEVLPIPPEIKNEINEAKKVFAKSQEAGIKKPKAQQMALDALTFTLEKKNTPKILKQIAIMKAEQELEETQNEQNATPKIKQETIKQPNAKNEKRVVEKLRFVEDEETNSTRRFLVLSEALKLMSEEKEGSLGEKIVSQMPGKDGKQPEKIKSRLLRGLNILRDGSYDEFLAEIGKIKTVNTFFELIFKVFKISKQKPAVTLSPSGEEVKGEDIARVYNQEKIIQRKRELTALKAVMQKGA